MRALVTGAGGFVGANLVRHLRDTGHEPVGLVRPGGSDWRLPGLRGNVRIEPVDLRDSEAVVRIVRRVAPDVVFHLAAFGAYSWQTDLDAMLAVNVRATEAILEGARATGSRVIHSGSSSEYGFRSEPAGECDRVMPNSYYAVTKAAATHLCSLAAATHGQTAITLRLYSIYGSWEEPGRLMPTLVMRALAGGYPPLVNPETARDFVCVDDACGAFVTAATSDAVPRDAVLNVASGHQTTLHSLVETARNVFAIPGDPAWGEMPGRSWDTPVWTGETGQTERTIGWRATTPLDAGLRRLGEWIAQDPARRALYGAPQTVAA